MRKALCGPPKWLVVLAGSFAIALSFMAYEIGLDNNPVWGPKRTALLLLGIVAILLAQRSWLARGARRSQGWLDRKMPRFFASSWLDVASLSSDWLRRRLGATAGNGNRAGGDTDGYRSTSRQLGAGLPSFWDGVLVSTFLIATLLVYVWVSTAGMWTLRPDGTSYYGMLAEAFLQQQTSLLIEPDPRLLELDNPYSLSESEGITKLWDVSYYQGEYFLYFGPAPAIAALIARLALRTALADGDIAILASGTLLVASALVLATLWRWGFAGRLPRSMFFVGLIAVGYSLPVLWVLNTPTIHEAAVASGMAFFVLGVLCALPSLASAPTHNWRLVLAGCFWALAVGSRATLVLPTVVAVALIGRAMLKRQGPTMVFLGSILCLLTPLAIGAGLLGWYNYDRFGDPLEWGFRYQLSWREGSMEYAFGPQYFLPNAYNYLMSGFYRLSVFPYIKPVGGAGSVPLPFLNYDPSEYFTEHISGTLVTVPANAFALFLMWWLLCGRRISRSLASQDGEGSSDGDMDKRIRSAAAAILVLALAGFLPVGFYYWAANRFLLDFVPLVTILAVLGAWIAADRAQVGCLPRVGIPALIALLFLTTAVMAILLALSGDTLRFEALNPGLFERMTRALTW